ncbi:hypothetical protein IV203_002393 [Nitzschia inconspicua]|uniref:Uncharacterized protein n=1 Tax=Nitzschia inconspicua TaxID=303405 RepID=A0A9K3LA25_9STRA|nr:hypothetical protein IV203_002393 [Nitzschia inconspicua]
MTKQLIAYITFCQKSKISRHHNNVDAKCRRYIRRLDTQKQEVRYQYASEPVRLPNKEDGTGSPTLLAMTLSKSPLCQQPRSGRNSGTSVTHFPLDQAGIKLAVARRKCPEDWHTGPFCHVYIAACESLDRPLSNQSQTKPVLQAFLSEIESTTSNTAANQQRQQGGHSADYLIAYVPINGGASTADKLLTSRIPVYRPMETVPLDEDSSNGLGSDGLYKQKLPNIMIMIETASYCRR